MDFTESTKILYSRIKKLEPNDASKILGFLFLQDNSNRDMIHLAYSTDNVILSMISKVKTELGLMSPNLPIFLQNAPPLALQLEPTNPYWNSPLPPPDHNIEFQHQPNVESIPQDSLLLQNHLQLLSLDENCYARSPSQGTTGLARVCHYFAKGFCKHGNTCRFLHENLNEGLNQDQLFSPRSLEMLEVEVTQLLRSRNGAPISIAMLPMLYSETYGKILQADGYLTESQRHGRAGLSLTKLLDRMRTNIRVIESRAHGQHSVVLAEDFPQYLDYGNEKIEYGGFPIAACQIYLTFPADSAFTEEEVCTHFKGYGPVLDVRLPFQQRRMFGFVTFVYPESVRGVLAKGNPHFIGGSRILVKPYREKPRTAEKRAAERKQPIYFGSQFVDGDSNPPQPVSRTSFDTRYVRQNFVEEYEGELELQRRRLSEFQLLPKQVSTLHGNDYSTAELKLKEVAAYGEQPDFQDPESFSFLFDSLSMMDGSTSEERTRCISSTCNDHNSYQGIIFPDSPFSYPVA